MWAVRLKVSHPQNEDTSRLDFEKLTVHYFSVNWNERKKKQKERRKKEKREGKEKERKEGRKEREGSKEGKS